MKRNRMLRRAVENPYIQTVFHAGGGLGLGLITAPLISQTITPFLGGLLLSAAILGHWYAVWSDPERGR